MSPDGRDDFDWLYEDERRTRSSPPRPSRPSNDLPPPQLPPPGSRAEAPSGPRKRRGKARYLWLILVAWIAFLVAVPFIAWGQVTKVDATPEGDRPSRQPGRTFVIVGSDARPDDTGRGRTDSILLLHTGSGPSVLTSLPRDSQVDIPGYGRTKINAAYAYGGPPLLVQTIEQNTGLQIDGYVEIGFTGLVDVVDALGGIEICPKEALQDADSGLDVQAGCQTVDGDTALAYSRNRKSYAAGDIARGEAQREVIGAIGAKARSPWTVLNPVRYYGAAVQTGESLAVGDDVSLFSFVRFAWSLSGAMGGNGLNCTVPIADMQVNWDSTRAPAFFEHLANDTTDQLGDLCTPNGLPPS
ncbi:LytR family transcriptional regulator [Aeromicrobium camelliae]|uniref:LytR family transcriptional regulator n=1 Tax=Aeromicrobium camelliae TaxID=1538144 RepID=A0A3N6X3V8_9ACTN|nr:LCP family protein [Aeromicrobium camelliae]RQN08323.1 LytR family transcriptional regulator [Aeromicrobium camelliae]